jgi:hypothetical protein
MCSATLLHRESRFCPVRIGQVLVNAVHGQVDSGTKAGRPPSDFATNQASEIAFPVYLLLEPCLVAGLLVMESDQRVDARSLARGHIASNDSRKQ